ncbi:MAG: hypothetical protein KAG28_06145 [Cocleimonas sp.]|nr:hypothetical protein [Cocleimonas sp.]
MKSILTNTISLKDDEDSYLFHEGECLEFSSTKEQADQLSEVALFFDQFFSALRDSDLLYTESHIEVDHALIIANILKNGHILLTITNTAPHAHSNLQHKRPIIQTPRSLVSNKTPSKPLDKKPTALSESAQLAIKKILINYLGPASTIIFNDVYSKWGALEQPTEKSRANLLKLLAEELYTQDEKIKFQAKAEVILKKY